MSPSISTFPVDDCLVMLNERALRLSMLNPTASLIWGALHDGLDMEALAGVLVETYGIPHEVARADVGATLAQWRSEGLLSDDSAVGTSAPQTPTDEESAPPKPRGKQFAPHSVRTYEVGGVWFRVLWETGELEQRVHPVLVHLAGDGSERVAFELSVYLDDAGCVIACDGEEVDRDPDREMVKSDVLAEMIIRAYPGRDLRAVLHAAAVGVGRRYVSLIGAPGAGKSTLAAALMHSGLSCMGDDCVPLCGSAYRALPFPVGVSLKEGSWGALAPLIPALEELPAYPLDHRQVRYLPLDRDPSVGSGGGAQVCGFVFPRYEPEAPTALEELSAAESFQGIFEARSWLKPPLTEQSVGEFVEWVRTVPAYHLVYSRLDEAMASVKGLLHA